MEKAGWKKHAACLGFHSFRRLHKILSGLIIAEERKKYNANGAGNAAAPSKSGKIKNSTDYCLCCRKQFYFAPEPAALSKLDKDLK
ncbi:MAG: hypothetical protein KH202_14585 [Clostridiales bacterium]|nr:hypothetical protein [Clostridiales bacterium]